MIKDGKIKSINTACTKTLYNKVWRGAKVTKGLLFIAITHIKST